MKLPSGIELIRVDREDLIHGPATFNRTMKTIFVAPIFDELQPFEQDFILCHEIGHLNTRDEFEADRLAFELYIKEGYSPSQAVEAIHNTLSYTKPDHSKRFLQLVKQAAEHDLIENKNENAKKILQMFYPDILTEEDVNHLKKYAPEMGVTEDQFDNFLGMSKKAAEKREERQAARSEKKQNKENRKNMRAEARTAILQSRANKNNAKANGTFTGTDIGGIFTTAGDTIKSVFGKNDNLADENFTEDEIYAMEEADRKKKTTTYIIIGVVVVVVAVVLFFVLSKKKK